MRVLHDFQGLAIRLTDERRTRILEHPEMLQMEPAIEETLLHPERVVQSFSDPQARLYYRFYSPQDNYFGRARTAPSPEGWYVNSHECNPWARLRAHPDDPGGVAHRRVQPLTGLVGGGGRPQASPLSLPKFLRQTCDTYPGAA